MKKEYPKSIFELIDSENFRKRTGMYIRKNSISNLAIFITGYSTCELFYDIKSQDIKPPFWLFYRWICKYYNHDGSYYNWDGIILQNCENDEEKALVIFFERFDEFRKFKPIKISKCQLDKKAIEFFYSHEGMSWRYVDGKRVRIGPANELYIVDYGEKFGNTIHHRIENKSIFTDYYSTIEKTIERVEMNYGKSLEWKEIPASDIEKTYEKINQ